MRLKIRSLLNNITTIHGISHSKSRKGLGITLWYAIILGNLLMTIAYILVIRNRYNSDQIITRINADCKVNQVPFPAVSICNFNTVSYKRTTGITQIFSVMLLLVSKVTRSPGGYLGYSRKRAGDASGYGSYGNNLTIRKNNNVTTEEIEEYYRYLPSLIHFRRVYENIDKFSKISSILKRHFFNPETIMEEVHQKCEDLLLYCTFNSKKKNCNEIFNLIKTTEGHCCAFNYAALNDENIDEISSDDDIEYYIDPSSNLKSSGIFVTSESGRGSGLSVVFTVEPNDYPKWSLTPYNGAKILLSDPNDYPEVTVLYKYLVIGQSLDIKVEPMIFQSDDAIRGIPIKKRNCVFHGELSLQHTDRFSTETCKTECKMKKYVEKCGCLPYKYPKDKASRICGYEDLKCLNNLRAHSIDWETECTTVCYIECQDKKYSITSDVMPLLPDFYPTNVTEGRDVSELSALQVYFAKSTCNCFKKILLIDFNYFIATYGGVFSLSFGISILTIFEVIYLLMSYLIRIIWINATRK